MSGILLVDAMGPDAARIARAAIDAGIELHIAYQRGAPPPESVGTLAVGGIAVDFADDAAAVKAMAAYAAAAHLDGVTTAHEYLTPLVARLSAICGVRGYAHEQPSVVRNKIDMVARLEAEGVKVPETFIARSMDDIYRLLAAGRLDFPFVIKPADGAGSVGVGIVAAESEIPDAFAAARAPRTAMPYGIVADERIVVQNYVHGVEYSVESVTRDGRTHHVCATEKLTTDGNTRVDLGLCVPAILPEETELALFAIVTRAVRALRIRDGVSHTEVKVGPAGECTVIEVGARIAGGRIPHLVQVALGIDLWGACVDAAVGRALQVIPTPSGYAVVRFLTAPRAGRFVGIAELPEAAGDVLAVEVRRIPGDLVGGPTDSKGRIGHIVVRGTTPERAWSLAADLVSRVDIAVVALEMTSSTGDSPRQTPPANCSPTSLRTSPRDPASCASCSSSCRPTNCRAPRLSQRDRIAVISRVEFRAACDRLHLVLVSLHT